MYEYGARAGFWPPASHVHAGRSSRHRLWCRPPRSRARPTRWRRCRAPDGRSPRTGCAGSTTREHSEDDEQRDLVEAIRLHREVTGERPQWIYLCDALGQFRKLAAARRRVCLASDTYDDDLPYWPTHDGQGDAIEPLTGHPPTRSMPTTCRLPPRRASTSGDQFFALSEGLIRHALRGGRGRYVRPWMSVGPALSPGRTAGAGGSAAALHRLREGPREGVALPADRHRRTLDEDPSLQSARPAAEPHGSRSVRRPLRRHLRAFR